jgi:hypothetical protein
MRLTDLIPWTKSHTGTNGQWLTCRLYHKRKNITTNKDPGKPLRGNWHKRLALGEQNDPVESHVDTRRKECWRQQDEELLQNEDADAPLMVVCLRSCNISEGIDCRM